MSQDETVRGQVRMAQLSLAQERIWHHSQRDPDSPLWRVVIAFRLTGPVTGERIELAFGRILDRHPLLRCRFQDTADGGATCIPTAGSPSLVVEDLTSVDQEDIESELQWYLSDLLQEPMDPSRGPAMALHLLEIDDDLHVLLCVFHRLVCDESCTGVLLICTC